MRKNKDIIKFARDIRTSLNTNNPYDIANYYGIQVVDCDTCNNNFTAHTIKVAGYPIIISINARYSVHSKVVLCAHELGHALLHQEAINHFAVTKKNIHTKVELEANLFAIALLTDDDIDDILDAPLEKLDGYVLKTIMEYNIY